MTKPYERLALALESIALTFVVAGCGKAPAPSAGAGDGGLSQTGGESFARAVVKYEDEMADLTDYPEPPPNKAGGIPPEDLTATPKNGGLLRMVITGLNDPHFT